MIATADMHWLAGFLDGEAYFGFNTNTCRVVVAQKYAWPLLKVQKLIGGNMYRVPGSCKPGRTYWALHITGKRAVGVMMTLYKMLSPRRQNKISAALAQWRLVPNRGANLNLKSI